MKFSGQMKEFKNKYYFFEKVLWIFIVKASKTQRNVVAYVKA